MNRDVIDRLSLWTKFRPSLCKECWAGCCTLPVEATANDLVRLGLISVDEINSGLKKAAKRLISSGQVKQYRAGVGIFTLGQTPNGDCLYLDKDRQCTVYEQRPNVCRKFPEIGPRPGYCPAQKRQKGKN